MSQDNQAAVQQQGEQPTPEQVKAQINAFRDGIIKTAVDNNLSFDVIFNALAQTTAGFVYDFNLLTKGEISKENVEASVAKFVSHLENVARVGLENMQEAARAELEAQRIADATPKIITEI